MKYHGNKKCNFFSHKSKLHCCLAAHAHWLYMTMYLTKLHLEPLHTNGVDQMVLIVCNQMVVFSAFHFLTLRVFTCHNSVLCCSSFINLHPLSSRFSASGLKIRGILVANATMFSHLLPGFSCDSKHLLLP